MNRTDRHSRGCARSTPVAAPPSRRGGERWARLVTAQTAAGGLAADALFVDRIVPVRSASVDPKQHFHVPLRCTPGGAGTYRGS